MVLFSSSMKNLISCRTLKCRPSLFEKNTFSRTRIFTAVLSVLLLLSALAWIGPGLNTPKAIGPYLNGAFPPLSTASPEPYRVAFENLSFFYPITFKQVPSQNKIVLGQLNGIIYWLQGNHYHHRKHAYRKPLHHRGSHLWQW